MAYVDFIVPGFDWDSPDFQILTDDLATDITDWELTADFFWRGRNSSARLDPTQVLLSLTTADTGFSIVSEALGKFAFDLTPTQTDYFRSADAIPGPKQKLMVRISRTDGSLKEFLCDIVLEVLS